MSEPATPFEAFMSKATTPGPDRLLPSCIVVAADKDGVKYSREFGTLSLDPTSPLSDVPFTLDTTMWIASLTKLMTAIAAMQCVEKGLLSLDDDVSSVLSEYREPEIITGFNDSTGEPILVKTKGRITLRMLLTHQSGLGYSFMHPELQQYVEYEKLSDWTSGPLKEHSLFPLLFEPGTSWVYGVGADWAGQMVERVNNNQHLGSYMEEHIWKPLGMDSTTFRLQQRADIKSRRTDMTMRNADGTLAASPTRMFPDECVDDSGGAGAWSSAADYVKMLVALLKNDGTLLKPATMELLFEPCLSPAAAEAFTKIRSRVAQKQNSSDRMESALSGGGGAVVPGQPDYAVGGLVGKADIPGRRKVGSMSWGGLPNLSWLVDRKSGVALLYASQLLPSGDPDSKQTFDKFEAAVYSGELGSVGSL